MEYHGLVVMMQFCSWWDYCVLCATLCSVWKVQNHHGGSLWSLVYASHLARLFPPRLLCKRGHVNLGGEGCSVWRLLSGHATANDKNEHALIINAQAETFFIIWVTCFSLCSADQFSFPKFILPAPSSIIVMLFLIICYTKRSFVGYPVLFKLV